MTQPIPIYYDGSLLSEDDYPNIAAELKIPYTDITTAVEQIRAKGEPLFSLYPSTTRARIREFAGRCRFTPDEPLVVDGLQKAREAPSPPIVAPSASEPVETPPEPLVTAKKAASRKLAIREECQRALDEEGKDESIAPAPLPESDDITDSAAVALMQAMTHGEGHFLITDDGICTINPASPPSLVHSYQVVQNVIQLGGLGEKVKDKQSWMLGSITAALEDYHGEEFQIGQVCEQTEKAENTIRQAVSVFRKFKEGKYNLSYSHHQEALHIKAPFEVTRLILHKAETYGLSAKNVRSLGSIYKAMDDDTTIRNIRSTQQAHDLMDAYRQAKVPYLIFTEGAWVRITGIGMDLPMASEKEHFPVVIDLKNWVSYANGERMADIPKRGLRKD